MCANGSYRGGWRRSISRSRRREPTQLKQPASDVADIIHRAIDRKPNILKNDSVVTIGGIMRVYLARLASITVMLFVATGAWAGTGGGNGTGQAINLPEPATLALLATGVGIALRVRSRRRDKKRD